MRDILLLRFLFVNFCVHLSFSVHDSMNFVLQPMKRECFFEDFDKNSPARTVEAFVQSGGNLDVMLTVHGPLELDEIRLVIALLFLIRNGSLKYVVGVCSFRVISKNQS